MAPPSIPLIKIQATPAAPFPRAMSGGIAALRASATPVDPAIEQHEGEQSIVETRSHEIAEIPHATLSRLHSDFLSWESVNDYFERVDAQSTVSEAYRPKKGREFDVKYLEIPVQDIHLVDSGLGDPALRRHSLCEREGRKYVRFFIHPDSEALYGGLIKRYGVAGTYRAAPTASTRTLLAWDPKDPANPLFLKLSLDRRQSQLGRVVPDWEVRRSVLISQVAESISLKDSKAYGVSIIPDFAGAYIDQSQAAGSYVDKNQHTVFQHGLIYRDPSFLKRFPGLQVYPLFALFSMRGAREPLIVEWWRQSGLPFERFIEKTIIAPIIKATSYLVFKQGIMPDAHAQNLLVAVDPKTRRVKHVFNRDAGSMKVDLRLRWSKGLPLTPLLTSNAAYDFRFPWAGEIAGRPILEWFYINVFGEGRGFGRNLKHFVPHFKLKNIFRLIQKNLKRSLDLHMPLPPDDHDDPMTPITVAGVRRHVERYLSLHKPNTTALAHAYAPAEIQNFIKRQKFYGQTMELPRSWFPDPQAFDSGPLVTENGVVYQDPGGRIMLAFLRPEGLTGVSGNTPTHYEMKIPIRLVRATTNSKPASAQAVRSNPFPVIKAGPREKPHYRLIDGLAHLASLRRAGQAMIKALVIQDITPLSRATQRKILGARPS